jgi:hypothetical protein
LAFAPKGLNIKAQGKRSAALGKLPNLAFTPKGFNIEAQGKRSAALGKRHKPLIYPEGVSSKLGTPSMKPLVCSIQPA